MASMSQIFYKLRKECKTKVNSSLLDKHENKNYCEIIWDGIMCWPKTEPGTEQSLPCPEYFGFSSKDLATKKCTESGQWYIDEKINSTWTNYTQCKLLYDNNTGLVPIPPSSENLNFIKWWFPKIKTFNHIGYSVSLTTLLIAITIFCCFKKLQCARNRLHMHLFLSLIMKAFISLLKDFLFVEGVALPNDVHITGENKYYVKEHNFWMCKAITSSWQYFILTNYTLILMEGIYLHNLLFFTFFSEKSNINIYAICGWGLPVCFVIPWIVLRKLFDDELCWTKQVNKYYPLLIHVPIIISTLINFILFINILNILIIKLNTMYIQQQKIKYRRLIRSTLILMPLFGVPYTISIFTWYFASTNQTVELIWLTFDQTFTSWQGFFVAFLYCLLNNEVQNELKKCFCSKRNNDLTNKRNERRHSFRMYAVSRSNRTSVTIEGNERRLTS